MSNISNSDDDNDDEATEQNPNTTNLSSELIEELNNLHKIILKTGKVTIKDLKNAYLRSLEDAEITTTTRIGLSPRNVPSTNRTTETVIDDDAITQSKMNLIYAFGFLVFIMILTPIVCEVIQFLLGVRCLVPNNYLVWEATRPISDCGFCRSVRAPLVLKNLTRDEFEPFAYSSQPIIIKNAVSHWPAIKNLNFSYLKNLYESIPGALDEECQFLHFRSDFMSLREVFQMSEERSKYNNGHKPWYVGWSNCHPIVLKELRKLYPRPHFLPEDAEMPNTDYIFLGYEQGAIMHLDYIPRLMWQAQLQGNKSWILAPTPECDQICHTFSFYVEPGDAVLVDTRIWYHGTSIPKGQFALTIQSEYG